VGPDEPRRADAGGAGPGRNGAGPGRVPGPGRDGALPGRGRSRDRNRERQQRLGSPARSPRHQNPDHEKIKVSRAYLLGIQIF